MNFDDWWTAQMLKCATGKKPFLARTVVPGDQKLAFEAGQAAARAEGYAQGVEDAAGIADKYLHSAGYISAAIYTKKLVLAAAGNPTDKESLTVTTPKYGTSESELARQGVDMLRGNPATVGEEDGHVCHACDGTGIVP